MLIGGVSTLTTIFYVVRQNRLHPRERVHLIEIEKEYNKYMEESTLLTSLVAALAAAGLLPWATTLSLLFLFTLSHTHVILNSHIALFVWCLFIGRMVASLLLSSSCTWESMVAAIFFNKGCCHLLSGGGHLLGGGVLPINGNT